MQTAHKIQNVPRSDTLQFHTVMTTGEPETESGDKMTPNRWKETSRNNHHSSATPHLSELVLHWTGAGTGWHNKCKASSWDTSRLSRQINTRHVNPSRAGEQINKNRWKMQKENNTKHYSRDIKCLQTSEDDRITPKKHANQFENFTKRRH